MFKAHLHHFYDFSTLNNFFDSSVPNVLDKSLSSVFYWDAGDGQKPTCLADIPHILSGCLAGASL